jgi:hypothetical protein
VKCVKELSEIMILFVDTYLSESPLAPNKKLDRFLRQVQDNSNAYRKQSKVDIFRYSLASYACLSWSKVIIRAAGDDLGEIELLIPYIKDLFPGAVVMAARSDTGVKYEQALEMAGPGDPWVFFSPNNDHPFIHHDPTVFLPLIDAAEVAEGKYGLPVSILYSHFTESINSVRSDQFLYGYTGDFCQVLEENNFSYTVRYNHLSLLSLQIFRKQYLQKLMALAGENRVIRTECLVPYSDYKLESIVIIPKVECCRHYDAYMHTSFVVRDFITASRVPPLFIPNGFFEGKMRIRYGFDRYDESSVNINPKKDKYIFDSSDGADLAISLDRIPFFWKARIAEVVRNSQFEAVLENDSSQLALDVINPWRTNSSLEIQLSVLYRRVFYSPIGAVLRKLANSGINPLRVMMRALRRG